MTAIRPKHHKGAGHRKRLRERFLTAGLDGFHDYEIIELLLTLGTPVKDCKDMAKAALAEFKSLAAVLEASADELARIHGLGPSNIFGLKLVRAVSDRCLKEKLTCQPLIGNPRQLFDYLNHSIRDKTREVFVGIFLNAKNRVLATETLFEGTLSQSAVYPREVVKRALELHAAAMIFCHNHPSGEPEPSPEDIRITRRLAAACRVVGVSVLDHVIIGDRGNYSFADNGYIEQIGREIESADQRLF
ncbi:MAG: DNA repair protein RadC [Thermodesulfobacteriota bacterium]